MSLQEQLETLENETLQQIHQTTDLSTLNQIRVQTLGKKGPITEVLRGMKELTPEERPKVGSFANQVRDNLTQQIEEKERSWKKKR
ncbi:hypothetical protein GCM10025854_28890 [Tetragenococcus muriaticus]|nr:hypothetical protein GCM10025854_28890 [Tetragenococcus muriaticus]